jgi:hypothetical protein
MAGTLTITRGSRWHEEWLTQRKMSDLFETGSENVLMHLQIVLTAARREIDLSPFNPYCGAAG